jgi:hypothetical protein
MDLKEMDYEIGSWMKMVQDRLKWRVLVLAVLSLQVLLPESCIMPKAGRAQLPAVFRILPIIGVERLFNDL